MQVLGFSTGGRGEQRTLNPPFLPHIATNLHENTHAGKFALDLPPLPALPIINYFGHDKTGPTNRPNKVTNRDSLKLSHIPNPTPSPATILGSPKTNLPAKHFEGTFQPNQFLSNSHNSSTHDNIYQIESSITKTSTQTQGTGFLMMLLYSLLCPFPLFMHA